MNLGSQSANRAEKVRLLVRAAELLLGRCGVIDFAAPGLVELVSEWPPQMWDTISRVAGVTVCERARKGERVCAECRELVIADFRGRPALAAALARMGAV